MSQLTANSRAVATQDQPTKRVPPDANAPAAKRPDGRGDFFTVDRRTWQLVCRLGIDVAATYLVLARGTGGDNSTTAWSVRAVSQYVGMSAARGRQAVQCLEAKGIVLHDPDRSQTRPRYKLVRAHEIKGCEGYPPPTLPADLQKFHTKLPRDEWVTVPKSASCKHGDPDCDKWGSFFPRSDAAKLVTSGHAEAHPANASYFRRIDYHPDAAARPQWIWLPNTLLDGAADEVSPVKLLWLTTSLLTLRMLVTAYSTQLLNEDGGIAHRAIRESYERHKLGGRLGWTVWGFKRKATTAWPDSPLVAPFLASATSQEQKAAGWKEFWSCWNRLCELGLVEFVAHVIHTDAGDGGVLHPLALGDTGEEAERALRQAAHHAALRLLTPSEVDAANDLGIQIVAPVRRHIEQATLIGVARLRYRPRTWRSAAFMSRRNEWTKIADEFHAIKR